jgi:SNF2 family DNA or RNA helicase
LFRSRQTGGVLQIRLEGEPPSIAIRQSGDVAPSLWNALGRNIAPGVTTRVGDHELRVPLDQFLAGRNWLGQALNNEGCEADLAPEVLALLERGNAERQEITQVMRDGTTPIDVTEVAALLEAGHFKRPLKPFQLRDLAQILALSHGANFSVPGAGKTTVAYATYAAERARGRVRRMLVVAPLSAFEAWVEEAGECIDPPPRVERFEQRAPRGAEVLLVNYQRLAARYAPIAAWVQGEPCHVVLDEAHRMKRGRNGEWGSACLRLAHLAVRRDILTGTPAPQHPSDFIALLDFIWPHQATRILPRGARQADPPPDVMADVSRRLQPLFSRTKKDELDLDDPILKVEVVDMKPLQAEIYDALRARMSRAVRSARERAAFADMGSVVMYLLEAATNPALLASAIGGQPSTVEWPPQPVPADSSLADLVLHYAEHEVPRKFEVLAAVVASNAADNRKTLVWSNFVANLRELGDHILAPYNPAVIHGGVPSGGDDLPEELVTRERELHRFRTDPRCQVLIANPAAMSEGVSLHHECHDAVYVDRTFNAGQYLQSVDRIHRLGLKPGTDTRITFLASSGTVDETVDDRIKVKAERLSEMLSDPNLVTMALPDEDAYGNWIDTDDLDALFAHLGVAGR